MMAPFNQEEPPMNKPISPAAGSALRQRFIEDMKVRGSSERARHYYTQLTRESGIFWIDDAEVIRDLIAINAPVPGHVVAQEVQHRDAEVLEGAVALVVSGMPVHQPP
jgi:hypothetical protein